MCQQNSIKKFPIIKEVVRSSLRHIVCNKERNFVLGLEIIYELTYSYVNLAKNLFNQTRQQLEAFTARTTVRKLYKVLLFKLAMNC